MNGEGSGGGAGGGSGVGDGGDEPLAVDLHEVEEVGATVVGLAVDEEGERGPDDGEVVVDADEGVVDALFNVRLNAGFGGLADALGEGFDGELGGLPSRMRTMEAPGRKGARMAAGSRAVMPANMAWMGARTAVASGVWAGRAAAMMRPRRRGSFMEAIVAGGSMYRVETIQRAGSYRVHRFNFAS